MEVYTVTTAYNGDSPDGSASATVEVYADLPTARAAYESERQEYAGRDYVGLWSTETPNGPAPEELPDAGWILAYAAPGEDDKPFDEEDEVGITLAAHPVVGTTVADRIWDLMEEQGEWDSGTIGDVAALLIAAGYPEFTDPNA